jgi:TRIAD3 protein (E3 ubiquitin-protein ligase RNF216)
MDPFASGQEREVIDLESDSEDDFEEFVGFDSDSEVDEALTVNSPGYAGGPENTIDLTALEDIPDVDVPPDPPVPAQPDLLAEDVELLSEAACLQMVINVLPDVSVDHVLTLIQERTHPRTHEECERLITDLLDGGAYPKEIDDANNKRKRKRGDDDDGDITKYENGEHNIDVPDYHNNA